ncbi:MAG TPA: FAD-dependent oxidoreductase [Streptosporangiaceae bacterium]|nr:FAD-dependent oxidoreductase [Streptosporangiaceae bacterium]
MKAVVVGGVAGGMSFAARARRLAEDAEIVVLERDRYVSYANCGLPYYVGGEITDRDALLVQTPGTLARSLALDVRTGHEVLAIDRDRRAVRVRERATGRQYEESYDALVLSTGAAPAVPPIPGVQLPAVRVLRTIPDADALRGLLAAGAQHAVLVGAGFIGLEVAEALRHRGLAVTLVELAGQVLPALDPEMARAVELELRQAGVDVRLGTSVSTLREAEGRTVAELSDGTQLAADLVLISAGVRPETTLAAAAGLARNDRGALLVNEHLQTSDPAIYGVGDAIEVVDAVCGAPLSVPLAGPANRQGRAAADHLFGRGGVSTPVLGTAIVRVFGTVAALTGRTESALRAADVPHHSVHLHPQDHAGYYPGAQPLHLKLVFAPDGRILGAQATGRAGVDKRIDVIATAIRGGLTVHTLAELELAYSPPFGSAKDPVNMAGFVASNLLSGELRVWHGRELATAPPGAVLVDVRSAAEFRDGHLPGARNIPHTELRGRLSEIPAGAPVLVYCASGYRSYLALRVLRQHGWPDVRSLSGGLSTLRLELPGLELAHGELAGAR